MRVCMPAELRQQHHRERVPYGTTRGRCRCDQLGGSAVIVVLRRITVVPRNDERVAIEAPGVSVIDIPLYHVNDGLMTAVAAINRFHFERAKFYEFGVFHGFLFFWVGGRWGQAAAARAKPEQ